MSKITIIDAQKYTVWRDSTCREMVYQIEYSDGTIVRAVESPRNIIRHEWLKNGSWEPSRKPYTVTRDKHRTAERIKQAVIEFLA